MSIRKLRRENSQPSPPRRPRARHGVEFSPAARHVSGSRIEGRQKRQGRQSHGTRPELCLDHDAAAEAGTREEFSRTWRPRGFPEGMLRAYECYSRDGNEVVGISIWDSPESRERFRLSEAETEGRRAMAPCAIEENFGFYVG